jgi:hypothetical protein
MRFPLADRQSSVRRSVLALTEIDALTVNMLGDVRALEVRLRTAGLGPATIGYPDLRLIETGAECIRHELAEARAGLPRRARPRWLVALESAARGLTTSTHPAA